jgi:chemotaxis protein methyltransferase CheR
MTPRECDYVAELVAARAGLKVDVQRPYLIESRLAAVARREGYGSVGELVRSLRQRGEERLVWAAVEAFVPGRGGFFREPQALEALARDLAATAAAGAAPRVWAAAGDAGQEIYSLAMLLDALGAEGVELCASDLSARRLEKAQAGVFSHFEVQQGLSARRLVRHFANRDDGFELEAELRRQVRWRRVNLIEPPADLGRFDVVLCRDLLGAYVAAARARVLANLACALRPGGRLLLGAGEPALAGLAAAPGRPGLYAAPAEIRAAA